MDLRGLSWNDIRELTRLLSRRPHYGIARPSGRWLTRQEEKIEHLPKPLVSSRNMLQRLVIGLASKHDSKQRDADKILPPSAVLCQSHERLNEFVIRDVFLTMIFEVSGDWMAALRTWSGKSPTVAAFLTRIDSMHALWVSKEFFHALFGTAPHNERYIRVQNNCEACILAAIGANGRILSDLYGWSIIRKEDSEAFNADARARGSPRRRCAVLLHRLVDAWIRHFKPENIDDVQRAGEDIAAELRGIWPAINQTRSEMRKRNERRAEVRLGRDGSTHLTETRGTPRGYGIPLPRKDLAAARLQRNMAGLHKNFEAQSVYRADTVVNDSGGRYNEGVVRGFRQQGLMSQPFTDESCERPGAPEPSRASGVNSIEAPRKSFVNRFVAEVPLPQSQTIVNIAYPDETYRMEYDERDHNAEADSVVKVNNWYRTQAFNATNTNLKNLDKESVHPAFQSVCQELDPLPMTNRSAIPPPLRLAGSGVNETSYQPSRADGSKMSRERPPSQATGLGDVDVKSFWTDTSIYTLGDVHTSTNIDDAPPIPPVLARYRAGNTTSSVPSLTTSVTSPASQSRSTIYGRGINPVTTSNTDKASHSDAYTQPPPCLPQKTADRRRYLFDGDSDAGSQLTTNNMKYLLEHRGIIKEIPPESNPFVRQNSIRLKRRADDEEFTSATPMPKRREGGAQPRYEGYAALNREAAGR